MNILLDTEEFAALQSICKFLRVRTAGSAVRWALVTAGAVVARKRQEVTGRVALQADLDRTNQNTESTRFVDFSQALDTPVSAAASTEDDALAHMEDAQ